MSTNGTNGKKKLLLIVVLSALVLVGGGFWGYRIHKLKPVKHHPITETMAPPVSGGTNTATIDWFTTIGPDVNKLLGSLTPLTWAAEEGNISHVETLLARGADINLKDNRGRTALMYLVGMGDETTNMVRFLIAHGADVNSSDNHGDTVLDYAPHTELEQILRQAGATSRWDIVKH